MTQLPGFGAHIRGFLVLLALLASNFNAVAAGFSPGELLLKSRSATFEVVVSKVENPHIKYEKPLPLELLSFIERNDKYWSIGTAFAIRPGVFASAAHVMVGNINGRLGVPALRDANGKVYPINQVLQFSLHEDFIVFTVQNFPSSEVLTAGPVPALGDSVFAVGNALGEGIVMRDGLMTSLTDEAQDGRWKWLRFSAAASPGNSGGPLLDSQGRVVGVIAMKSPNENLNYALPIERIIKATAGKSIDVRASIGLPLFRQQFVVINRADLELPALWGAFAKDLSGAIDAIAVGNTQDLLKEHEAILPPQGNVANLFGDLNKDSQVAILLQESDESWDLTTGSGANTIELPGDGKIWTRFAAESMTFRVQRGNMPTDLNEYHASYQRIMDELLLGLKLTRPVGAQEIRMTSLGPAASSGEFSDRFGRRWQVHTWSLSHMDTDLIIQLLPTPEGVVGIAKYAFGSSLTEVQAHMRLLADYFHVNYQGTLAQWQGFLRGKWCPPYVQKLELSKNYETELKFSLRGITATVPAAVATFTPDSILKVLTGYSGVEKALVGSLEGITLSKEKVDDEAETTWLGIWGRSTPLSEASSEVRTRWKQMSEKHEDFSGQPFPGSEQKSFWTKSVWGDASKGTLYEVVMNLHESELIPRQVSARRDALLAGMRER
jgi:serine protease Do